MLQPECMCGQVAAGLSHGSIRQASPNQMLAHLCLDDFQAIRSHLQPVLLKPRAVLQEQRRSADGVYFIESGLVSLRVLATDSLLQIAFVGRGGAVGASLALGIPNSIHQSVVLFSGRAQWIAATDLRQLMIERPGIRECLLNYAHGLLLHTSQVALCCARHHPEQRIATWLCLASDGHASVTLPVTHDDLSLMLGLRRPTVTATLLRLEENGLVRKMRGVLEVRDREGLEQNCCPCFRIITDSYRAERGGVCQYSEISRSSSRTP